MHFEHKYIETEPSCSHELATFLKYHMPLRLRDASSRSSRETCDRQIIRNRFKKFSIWNHTWNISPS